MYNGISKQQSDIWVCLKMGLCQPKWGHMIGIWWFSHSFEEKIMSGEIIQNSHVSNVLRGRVNLFPLVLSVPRKALALWGSAKTLNFCASNLCWPHGIGQLDSQALQWEGAIRSYWYPSIPHEMGSSSERFLHIFTVSPPHDIKKQDPISGHCFYKGQPWHQASLVAWMRRKAMICCWSPWWKCSRTDQKSEKKTWCRFMGHKNWVDTILEYFDLLRKKWRSGWWVGCHEFYFPINIGLLIIPIDFHIFQRGSNHQPVEIFDHNTTHTVFDAQPIWKPDETHTLSCVSKLRHVFQNSLRLAMPVMPIHQNFERSYQQIPSSSAWHQSYCICLMTKWFLIQQYYRVLDDSVFIDIKTNQNQ